MPIIPFSTPQSSLPPLDPIFVDMAGAQMVHERDSELRGMMDQPKSQRNEMYIPPKTERNQMYIPPKSDQK